MKTNKKNKGLLRNEQGFTLIEIIAVIIIMGILAAVAVPKFFSMQEDAKIAALNGGLSEAIARFNHAYAKYILINKIAFFSIGESILINHHVNSVFEGNIFPHII